MSYPKQISPNYSKLTFSKKVLFFQSPAKDHQLILYSFLRMIEEFNLTGINLLFIPHFNSKKYYASLFIIVILLRFMFYVPLLLLLGNDDDYMLLYLRFFIYFISHIFHIFSIDSIQTKENNFCKFNSSKTPNKRLAICIKSVTVDCWFSLFFCQNELNQTFYEQFSWNKLLQINYF